MRVVRFKLSEILEELGWTQRKLAAEAGLSENAVSTLARNPQQISLETIAKLCHATGKEPGDLFEMEETES